MNVNRTDKGYTDSSEHVSYDIDESLVVIGDLLQLGCYGDCIRIAVSLPEPLRTDQLSRLFAKCIEYAEWRHLQTILSLSNSTLSNKNLLRFIECGMKRGRFMFVAEAILCLPEQTDELKKLLYHCWDNGFIGEMLEIAKIIDYYFSPEELDTLLKKCVSWGWYERAVIVADLLGRQLTTQELEIILEVSTSRGWTQRADEVRKRITGG